MTADEGLGLKGAIPTPSTVKPSGITNSAGVTPILCEAYRDHLETKIGDMETNIKNAVYLAGFVITCLQLALHYFG